MTRKERLQKSIDMLQVHLSGHSLEALITLAIVTGMRPNELLTLTWFGVDLEKREISVVDSKTSRSRHIQVAEEHVQVLSQHRKCQMKQYSERSILWSHSDLVFPDQTGGLLRLPCLLKQWYALLKQVGLQHLRFHDLRACMALST